MTPDELVEASPRLYHMAAEGAWPSIQRLGLLSTTAILDLFKIDGDQREVLEARHRPASVELTHPEHGTLVLRDQKPLSDSGLARCLEDGLDPSDWYRILNQRVFCWATEDRVSTLLNAGAYRRHRHTVLTLDAAEFARRYGDRIEVTTINTGSTRPYPHPRGRDSFVALAEFDYRASRRKRGRQRAIAEVVVPYAIPDIAELVTRVERRGGGTGPDLLFDRG